MSSPVILFLFFIGALVISIFLHRFFVIRAERYKIKKANTSAERWNVQTKPILGGITFYTVFLLSVVAFLILFSADQLLQPDVLGTILAVTVAFLMGMADDMLNTPPGFKFIFQVICAFIVIYSGIYIQIFENQYLNYALTLFWVIGIMNSLNMLDNMDAITTSVSSSILLGAIGILVFQQSSLIFLILAIGVFSSMIGFLYYNWNPSKMYMGDNGSQFLGAFMAIVGIKVFWNAPVTSDYPVVSAFMLTFMAFIVPISDTTSVTINRIMRGQSPFIGGRDHTTHHLSYFGLSDRKVAILLLTVSSIFVLLAVLIIIKPQWISVSQWFLGILSFLVLVVLYSITKISKPKK